MAYITKLDLRIKNQKLITIMKYLTFLTGLGIFLFTMNACSLEYTQDEMDSALDFKDAQFQHLLNATNEEIKGLEDTRDTLTSRVYDLTSKLALMSLENANLRSEISELNELNEELNATISLLIEANTKLANDLTLSEAQVELLEGEIFSLKLDVDNLTAEINSLSSALESALQLVDALTLKISSYESQIVGLYSGLSGLSSQNSSLQSQIDDLTDVLEYKVKKIDRLKNRIAKIKVRNQKDLQSILDLANDLSSTPWAAYFKIVNELKKLID